MAVKRIEVLASAARTAAGNSEPFKLQTGTMAFLGVDYTAGSGTITDHDLWLEASDDNGVTWYPVAADQVVPPSLTVATNQVNVVNNKATTTAEKYSAVYKHTPSDTYRIAWGMTGTTPSLTFSASVVAK